MLSRWEQILSTVPEADRRFVAAEASAHLNMVSGCRPSDAAQRAVEAYTRGTLTRRNFCASRISSPFYPGFVCVCGGH